MAENEDKKERYWERISEAIDELTIEKRKLESMRCELKSLKENIKKGENMTYDEENIKLTFSIGPIDNNLSDEESEKELEELYQDKIDIIKEIVGRDIYTDVDICEGWTAGREEYYETYIIYTDIEKLKEEEIKKLKEEEIEID